MIIWENQALNMDSRLLSDFVLASIAFVLPNAHLLVAMPPIPQKKGMTYMRYKNNKVQFYLFDKDKKKLDRLAEKSGLTKTTVLTKLIQGCEIKPLPSEELLKIYKELNHIGTNINQIAYIANSNRYISGEKINEVNEMLINICSNYCVNTIRKFFDNILALCSL